MEIIWTKTAKKNIRALWYNSPIEMEAAMKIYILGLLSYIEILKCNPNLGKVLPKYKDYICVRQLIYRKHKIIYTVEEDVYILTIIANIRNVNYF